MSAVTPLIKIGKKVKRRFKVLFQGNDTLYLSPVRRIERVATQERICAMTFDDGPCAALPQPDTANKPQGKSLTASLLNTLQQYDAKGTFDVVGDTSGNYPDVAGKLGSPSWGGVSYDHYPDLHLDHLGGAVACSDLITRIIAEGHEITNHGYAHILFGKKPLVYGKRVYLENLEAVLSDLQKLHQYMEKNFQYTMKLSRPPHYVDRIAGGFSSYDAYAQMGYQYMAASFDGAGWLPCKSYEEEVTATYQPMKELLEKDPNYFCGQIIFQKDGYNMAKRSPVVDGLGQQLALLQEHGYRVVTVSALLAHSPFADVGMEDKRVTDTLALEKNGRCLVYRDNTLRLHQLLTMEELAMVFFGKAQQQERIALMQNPQKKPMFPDVPATHPYSAAIEYAVREGFLTPKGKQFQGKREVTGGEFNAFCHKFYGGDCGVQGNSLTRRTLIKTMKHLEQE